MIRLQPCSSRRVGGAANDLQLAFEVGQPSVEAVSGHGTGTHLLLQDGDGERSLGIVESRVTLVRDDVRVEAADLAERIVGVALVELLEWVAADQGEVELRRRLVPQTLQLDRLFDQAHVAQVRHDLAVHHHGGPGGGGTPDRAGRQLVEPSVIEFTVHLEPVQRVDDVEDLEAASATFVVEIDPRLDQRAFEHRAVRAGDDGHDRVAGHQRPGESVAQRIFEERVRRVQLDEVLELPIDRYGVRHGVGGDRARGIGIGTDDVGGGDGGSPIEPLAEVAAQRHERVALRRRLDAFGHHVHPQRVRQVDDRGHDGGVFTGATDAGGEQAVDLQLLHREALQVRQARPPGAEVVDAQVHTQRSDLGEHPQDLVDVAHQRRLGDLEPQPAGLEPTGGQCAFHFVGEIGVLQLSDRDVHRQPRGPADASIERHQVGARPDQDATPELHDLPGLLCERDEVVWSDDATLRVLPAGECFEAEDGAGAQIDLALEVDDDLVAFDRPVESELGVDAVRRSHRPGRHLERGHDDAPVAPVHAVAAGTGADRLHQAARSVVVHDPVAHRACRADPCEPLREGPGGYCAIIGVDEIQWIGAHQFCFVGHAEELSCRRGEPPDHARLVVDDDQIGHVFDDGPEPVVVEERMQRRRGRV